MTRKPPAICAGPFTILPHRRLVMHGNKNLPMSSRQYDCFELLALANGRPVAPADIILLVLGRSFRGEGDQGAARMIFGLRKKLPQLSDGRSIIVNVVGAGYTLLMRSMGAGP